GRSARCHGEYQPLPGCGVRFFQEPTPWLMPADLGLRRGAPAPPLTVAHSTVILFEGQLRPARATPEPLLAGRCPCLEGLWVAGLRSGLGDEPRSSPVSPASGSSLSPARA